MRRDPAIVLLLSILTCGLYAFYHQYQTTIELVALTGRQDINANTEFILTLVTCGMFGMFVIYRNQQVVDEWFLRVNIAHEPQANTVGLMMILTFVVGVTYWVGIFMHQSELNKLIDISQGHHHMGSV